MEYPHRNYSEIRWYGSLPRSSSWLFLGAVVSFFLFSALISGSGFADSDSDRRVIIGIKLFRTMLAADLSIENKTDKKGRLVLVLFYTKDRGRAIRLADKLKTGGAIREHPISIIITDDPWLAEFRDRFPAGIFLTERPHQNKTIDSLVAFGKRRGVIVYSPFEGHVEQGVTGGIYIANRVRPYVNLRTIGESGIKIKKFFMKVAKKYD